MPNIGEIVIPESFESLQLLDVLRAERALGTLWSSAEPTIDVQAGALQSLLLQPFATLFETARSAFQQGGQQSSLAYLLSAPSAQVAPLLDALATNYRITRREGRPSSGRLRLVFSRMVTVSVGPSDLFEANGVRFAPVRQVTVDSGMGYQTDAAQMFPVPDNSGNFFMDVEVMALNNNGVGNLVKGTEAQLVYQRIPSFVRAFAVETFTGGADDESNHDLVQRMLYGVSAKVLSSRTNMKASLLATFPDVRDSSIIGAGDDEMTRDKHSIFPGATGGYADWYVATTRQLLTVTHSVDLNPSEDTEVLPDGSVKYRLLLSEENFPGLYWVSGITDATTNEPCSLLQQRKYAVQGAGGTPRIYEDEEAMFSAYQETEVFFTGQKDIRTVNVSGTYMPLIREIQDWVLHCGQSPVGLDILVKGAVPVTVQFSAILNTPMGTDIDLVSLQGKVADHVNAIPFDGVLSVSGLTALLHASLPAGSYINDQALSAMQWLSDSPAPVYVHDRLTLEQFPFGTNRTSILYCDPSQVFLQHRFIDRHC